MAWEHDGCVVDILIALEVVGRCPGALGGAGPLPLLHHRLLAEQDGGGSANGSRAEIWAELVLEDRVPDAAERALGALVHGGPHVGGGKFPVAGSPLHGHHYTFAMGHGLHAHSRMLNRSLQVTGLSAVCLLVPLDREAGTVPEGHPLQVHGLAVAPLTTAAGDGKSRTLTFY